MNGAYTEAAVSGDGITTGQRNALFSGRNESFGRCRCFLTQPMSMPAPSQVKL